jgi:hypothetical protein
MDSLLPVHRLGDVEVDRQEHNWYASWRDRFVRLVMKAIIWRSAVFIAMSRSSCMPVEMKWLANSHRG